MIMVDENGCQGHLVRQSAWNSNYR